MGVSIIRKVSFKQGKTDGMLGRKWQKFNGTSAPKVLDGQEMMPSKKNRHGEQSADGLVGAPGFGYIECCVGGTIKNSNLKNIDQVNQWSEEL